MKKLASFLLLLSLTGCSALTENSEIEYNNKIVESINSASSSLENSATLYNELIPDVVTEITEVDPSQIQVAYDEAISSTESLDDLLQVESGNIEQQNAVRPAIENYTEAADEYLEAYLSMLEYYSTGTYKTDITGVKSMDETLHTAYMAFIQANNTLVETLDQFVATEK